jgi:DNA-binding MarR family transcriptional regulator
MASQHQAYNLPQVANDQDMTVILHKTMLSLVKRDGLDLTARQLGIFLTVYLEKGPHTVRRMAVLFNICKPAVTRSLDRLAELDLARRKVDPRDRRSVLVHPTEGGWTFLAELRSAMAEATTDAEWVAASRVEPRSWRGVVRSGRNGSGQGFAANS